MDKVKSSSKPRSSNKCRSQWRDRCRKELANHIAQSLGYIVDPQEVRLVTRPTDRYVWHHAPGQNHLFSKQLSKHNIGAYREICRELGKSIQVVSIDREQNGNGCAADESNLFRAGRGMTSDDLHGTKGLDHRYFVDLTRTVQTLEAETADLRGQLDEALSLCEERGRSVEELQADSGRMKRQFSHLQATLHLRNAEATRRTHLLETNARRLQQLGGLLRDWEREVA